LQHIELIAQLPASLPPILVHRPTMRVIDGMHRLRAAQLKHQTSITARFFDGTSDDAFVLAVRANQAHGLPLTIRDREAAAERIIAAQPHNSDRTIASITGLAPRTVASLRRRVSAPDHTSRIGRDGRLRPLNIAAGRLLARDAIEQNPRASLREIAAIAGVSPATARDVRERLRRGESPVPAGHSAGTAQRDPANDQPAHTEPAQPQHRPTGSHPTPRDRVALLRTLNKDPTLRFSQSGRSVLRWLFARAKGTDSWEAVLDHIPPHCRYIVAELAHACANEWLALAERLRERLESSA
jgi:DNA-binding CsgD family transcriptional regulator